MSELHWETNFTSTYHQKSYPTISPTRPELSTAGKTIFVSGGGRGLGVGIVEAFAISGAAHIIILGRSATSLKEVAERIRASYPSTKISTVSGDVSIEADVARAFAEAGAGGIDVVVANAAYFPTLQPIGTGKGPEFTEDWWKAWEVNVKGLFFLARQFLASAPPGGVFINISAAGAHINPTFEGFSGYFGSKLGAARVVEVLQKENTSFRFHNVHPGVVDTDMLTKAKIIENFKAATDEPDLPGHFINWVASSEGEFLKGKLLWVNWDVDELKARREELSAPTKLVTGLVGWA